MSGTAETYRLVFELTALANLTVNVREDGLTSRKGIIILPDLILISW